MNVAEKLPDPIAPEDPDLPRNELVLVEQESRDLIQRANELIIVDAATLARAQDVFASVEDQERAITELLEPLRAARYAAYERVLGIKNERLGLLKAPKESLRSRIKAYLRERDERIRREQAERQRQAEIIARARRFMSAVADALASCLDEERRLAEAVEAERQGDAERAERILDAEPSAPLQSQVAEEPVFMPPIETEAPKIDQRKFGRKWKARVVDVRKACAAVARGELSPRCVSFVASELNAAAKAFGGVRVIDGIEFYEE